MYSIEGNAVVIQLPKLAVSKPSKTRWVHSVATSILHIRISQWRGKGVVRNYRPDTVFYGLGYPELVRLYSVRPCGEGWRALQAKRGAPRQTVRSSDHQTARVRGVLMIKGHELAARNVGLERCNFGHKGRLCQQNPLHSNRRQLQLLHIRRTQRPRVNAAKHARIAC